MVWVLLTIPRRSTKEENISCPGLLLLVSIWWERCRYRFWYLWIYGQKGPGWQDLQRMDWWSIYRHNYQHYNFNSHQYIELHIEVPDQVFRVDNQRNNFKRSNEIKSDWNFLDHFFQLGYLGTAIDSKLFWAQNSYPKHLLKGWCVYRFSLCMVRLSRINYHQHCAYWMHGSYFWVYWLICTY